MLDGTADGFLAASLDTVEGAFAPAPTTSAFASAATSLLERPEALPGEAPHVESWDLESFGVDSSVDHSFAPPVAPVDDVVVEDEVADEVVDEVEVVEDEKVDEVVGEDELVDDVVTDETIVDVVADEALVEDEGTDESVADESAEVVDLVESADDIDEATDVADDVAGVELVTDVEVVEDAPLPVSDLVEFDAPEGEALDLPAPSGEAFEFAAPESEALDLPAPSGEAFEFAAPEGEVVARDVTETDADESLDFDAPAGDAAPLNYVALVPKWDPNDFVAPGGSGAPELFEPSDETDDAPLALGELGDEWMSFEALAGEPIDVEAEAVEDVPVDEDEHQAEVIELPVAGHDDENNVELADGPLPLPTPVEVVVDETFAESVPANEDDEPTDALPLPTPALVDEDEIEAVESVEDEPLHVEAPALVADDVDVANEHVEDEPLHVEAPELLADDEDEFTSDIPFVAPLAAEVPALLVESPESSVQDDVDDTPLVALHEIPAVVPLLAEDEDEEIVDEVVEETPAPVLPPAEQLEVDPWEPPLSSFEAVAPTEPFVVADESDSDSVVMPAAAAFDRVGLPIYGDAHDDRTFAPSVGEFPPLEGEGAAPEHDEYDDFDSQYRAPMPPLNSSMSSKFKAESARDFAPEVSAFGFGDVVAPSEEPSEIHYPEPSQYQPGDVENGYVLNENYHWVPAAPPVSVGKMPAMWLDDPMVAGQRRYWDGEQWTEAIAQADSSVPEHSMSGAQAAPVEAPSRPVRPTKAINSFTAAAGAAGNGGSTPWNSGVGPVATSPMPKRMSSGKAAVLVIAAVIVGVVFVGGIAAVAVPAFFQQRAKQFDAAVMADIENTAHSLRTYVGTTHKFPKTAAQLENQAIPLHLKNGDAVVIFTDGHSGFCIAGYSTSGHYKVQTPKLYDSKKGGLQQDGVKVCQTRWTTTLRLP